MFTPAKLQELRRQYQGIERVNPEGEAYKKMKATIDGMPEDMLKEISKANIKWLSTMALTRIIKLETTSNETI